MLRSGKAFKMLKSGSVVKFNLSNQKYILLGLNSYNDRDLELDVEIMREVRLLFSRIKDKDIFIFMVVFFTSDFDFVPYDEFKSEKPIKNVFHYSLLDMASQRVKVVKNEDINLYLMKNALVNENVKKYLKLDIGEILKRKKEQLGPYIIKALNTKWGYF